jgi:hypothetical protein
MAVHLLTGAAHNLLISSLISFVIKNSGLSIAQQKRIL